MTRYARSEDRHKRIYESSVEMTPRPGPPQAGPWSMVTKVMVSDPWGDLEGTYVGQPEWVVMNDKRVVGIEQVGVGEGPFAFTQFNFWSGDYPTGAANLGQVSRVAQDVGRIDADPFFSDQFHTMENLGPALATDGESRIWILIKYVRGTLFSGWYQYDLYLYTIGGDLEFLGVCGSERSQLNQWTGSPIDVEDFWPIRSMFYNPADDGLYAYAYTADDPGSTITHASLLKFMGPRVLPPGSQDSPKGQAWFQPVLSIPAGVFGFPFVGYAFAPNGNLYEFNSQGSPTNFRKYVSATDHTVLWNTNVPATFLSYPVMTNDNDAWVMMRDFASRPIGVTGRTFGAGSLLSYYSTLHYREGVLDTTDDVIAYFPSDGFGGYGEFLTGVGTSGGTTRTIDGAVWLTSFEADNPLGLFPPPAGVSSFYRYDPLLVGTELVTARPTAQASEIFTRYHRF